MDLIHILANTSKINMGVWNSSLLGKDQLSRLGVNSFFWSCDPREENQPEPFIFLDLQETNPLQLVNSLNNHFNPETTLIITHGAWLSPTRIGYFASLKNYSWIYVPHGMLEPWSISQNKFFKRIYYQLFEKRYIQKSKAIRAVSIPEKIRLEQKFNKEVFYIPNGVALGAKTQKDPSKISFLFMSRLHHKKGILPLVKAWSNTLLNEKNFELCIAGPDEGELEKIQPFIKENIQYLGPIYGEEKIHFLKKAHYYFLPSFSEGFPTSVLEAMAWGGIPLISKGCNFEETFTESLGYLAEPKLEQLEDLLKRLSKIEYNQEQSDRNVSWIEENYDENKLANKLFEVYSALLPNVHKG